MFLTPQEGTRTPERSCVWLAECVVDDNRFQAHARLGASNALARVLVAASVADEPVRIFDRRRRGYMELRSLHEMAKWTYADSPSNGLRRVPFVDVKAVFERHITAKHQGEEVEGYLTSQSPEHLKEMVDAL